MKNALVTGVTGQDGSYLTELLLSRGFKVFGGIRRNSDFTTNRINHIFNHDNFVPFNYDAADASSVGRVLADVEVSYFFNLAAMSHVGTSFDIPNYATLVDGASVVHLVDMVKRLAPSCVFYQASTSELFGGSVGQAPQDLKTNFDPRSPYSVAKLMAHYTVLNARRTGELLTVSGILFNHESPRRGKTFVTKKITRYVADFSNGQTKGPLQLGNLDAVRDWGYAPDYVQVILDSVLDPKEQVYCCGTTIGTTVRDFARLSFAAANVDIAFEGSGLEEVGYEIKTGRTVLEVNSKYFRPLEVDTLIAGRHGNLLLGYDFFTVDRIVEAMVGYDLKHDEYGGLEDDSRYSRFWPK